MALVLGCATLAVAVPLLAVAGWFAYDAVTSTSEWAALGLLVTVAITTPVVPAVVLAGTALRTRHTRPRLAHRLAVTGVLMLLSVVLVAGFLGLA